MTFPRAPFGLASRRSLTHRSLIRSFPPSYSCAFFSSLAAKATPESHGELFEYTSGRWLYNEPRRLSERRSAFNVDELKKAAATSLNRHPSDVQSLRKIAEGGFNRVFEVSMKDGASVIARLPYPTTVPRRWAVASEVATLGFVRAAGLPAPRVLGYSIHGDADGNGVGAEYILMEKVAGKPIGDAWFALSEQQRLMVLKQIVELEARLFAVGLPGSGSIYYARDLDSNTPRVDIPGFDDGLCIGPYAAQRWWEGERGELDIDRGPHTNPRLVLQTAAEKELSWIRAHGRPRFPFERAHRETFDYKKQDPEEYAKSLLDYIHLAPHLVPTDPQLNLPVLRHPDLQPNIFISENFTITSLIDWQHALVLPTFLAAGMPNSFQNYDDEESLSFIPPHLPPDLDSMDSDDRATARERFRRRHVHFFYLGFTQRLNAPHFHALEQETSLLKRRIFNSAGSPWEGLNTPLEMDVVRVSQNWSEIAAVGADGKVPACPVVLGEDEIQRRTKLDEALREVDSDMEYIRGSLGISADGWTSHENFESAKERAKFIRKQGLAAVSDDAWLAEMTDQHWPLDDCDEDV